METTEANLARPPVVSQTEWDAALTALLERERNVAAAMHELAAARKRMPMVRVEHDYAFEGPDGRRSLPELFDGRSQLILYRFFFEEGVDGWPDAGCVGCSSVADGIPELGSGMLATHLRMASPSPQANLAAPRAHGWKDGPVHDTAATFSADFGVDVVRLQCLPADGHDVYAPTSCRTDRGPGSAPLWACGSLTPMAGSPRGTCPRLPRARCRSGSAARRVPHRRRGPLGSRGRLP